MAKKVETEAAPVQEKEVKKRPNYQRKMPIQYGPKRGKRLAPVPSLIWPTVWACPVRA